MLRVRNHQGLEVTPRYLALEGLHSNLILQFLHVLIALPRQARHAHGALGLGAQRWGPCTWPPTPAYPAVSIARLSVGIK